MADKVALKLNEIVDDPQTIQDVSAYRKTRERKDIDGQKFSEQLTSLIHDIGLGTKFLGGACYGCLNLHDEKEYSPITTLVVSATLANRLFFVSFSKSVYISSVIATVTFLIAIFYIPS